MKQFQITMKIDIIADTQTAAIAELEKRLNPTERRDDRFDVCIVETSIRVTKERI